MKRNVYRLVYLIFSVVLVACGGGGGSSPAGSGTSGGGSSGGGSSSGFTIGGSISGLASGTSVVLNNSGGDSLTITANGIFTFSTPVAANGSYVITVATQPTGEICTASNGTGSGVVANVSNISVICSATSFTVSGTVSGLTGSEQVTLLANGGNPVTVTKNGAFNFSTPIAENASFSVTVGTQPVGEVCSVTNGFGAGTVANYSKVNVACSASTFTIGGNVAGLAAGEQVTLFNNGANPVAVTSNSGFTFSTPVALGGSYNVTVGTLPVGQVCSVSNGTGSNVSANVVGVGVICSGTATSYYVSGNVSGLTGSQQVTLLDNGTDPTTIASNGSFTFAAPIADSAGYDVSVLTEPILTTCNVTNGSGSGNTTNIIGVNISCLPSTGSVLSTFLGSPGPGVPSGNIIEGIDGNFYGVTDSGGIDASAGGEYDEGALYRITSAGVTTVLHSFGNGSDGAFPEGNLIQYMGNFYGVTYSGGSYGFGTIYKITPSGNETVVYNFPGGAAGSAPTSGLTVGNDGNLYGVTTQGGTNSVGVFYQLTAAEVFTPLYSFGTNANDAINPAHGLILGEDGNFYGISYSGGSSNLGALYQITPSGTESVWWSFKGGGSDGANPGSPLIKGLDGYIYGTTNSGGSNNNGTFFRITASGTESVLYNFGVTSNDGKVPAFLVIGSDGNFYGVTELGGAVASGTIFQITSNGAEKIVYSFASNTGKKFGLIQASDGHFYGACGSAAGTGGEVFKF